MAPLGDWLKGRKPEKTRIKVNEGDRATERTEPEATGAGVSFEDVLVGQAWFASSDVSKENSPYSGQSLHDYYEGNRRNNLERVRRERLLLDNPARMNPALEILEQYEKAIDDNCAASGTGKNMPEEITKRLAKLSPELDVVREKKERDGIQETLDGNLSKALKFLATNDSSIRFGVTDNGGILCGDSEASHTVDRLIRNGLYSDGERVWVYLNCSRYAINNLGYTYTKEKGEYVETDYILTPPAR